MNWYTTQWRTAWNKQARIEWSMLRSDEFWPVFSHCSSPAGLYSCVTVLSVDCITIFLHNGALSIGGGPVFMRNGVLSIAGSSIFVMVRCPSAAALSWWVMVHCPTAESLYSSIVCLWQVVGISPASSQKEKLSAYRRHPCNLSRVSTSFEGDPCQRFLPSAVENWSPPSLPDMDSDEECQDGNISNPIDSCMHWCNLVHSVHWCSYVYQSCQCKVRVPRWQHWQQYRFYACTGVMHALVYSSSFCALLQLCLPNWYTCRCKLRVLRWQHSQPYRFMHAPV